MGLLETRVSFFIGVSPSAERSPGSGCGWDRGEPIGDTVNTESLLYKSNLAMNEKNYEP